MRATSLQLPTKASIPEPIPLELWVLGLGFCFVFAGYSSVEVLATATYHDLGAYSLALVYGFMMSSAFLAPLLIDRLGAKLSLCVGSSVYLFFVGAMASGFAALMLLSSALVGFGSAILWTASGLVVARISSPTSHGRNTGIFYALFRCARIVGNLFSALLLHAGWSVPVVFTCLITLVMLGCACLGLLFLFPDSPPLSQQQQPSLSRRADPCSKASLRVLYSRQFLAISGLMLVVCGLGKGWLTSSFSEQLVSSEEVSVVFAAYGLCLIPATFLGGLCKQKIHTSLHKFFLLLPFVFGLCGVLLAACLHLQGESWWWGRRTTEMGVVLCYGTAVGLYDSSTSALLSSDALFPADARAHAVAAKILAEGAGTVLFLLLVRRLSYVSQLVLLLFSLSGGLLVLFFCLDLPSPKHTVLQERRELDKKKG
eukprot:gb/GEZN01001936.1/.p1 GENE.gb/GEZN01001936.1/~~gb/GEZN01001936.1/.p1  ORF type:complete len:427 (-),score=59.76 gb/GEZN01001936.1/:1379-2659(-)